jgi:hypothetical protein
MPMLLVMALALVCTADDDDDEEGTVPRSRRLEKRER